MDDVNKSTGVVIGSSLMGGSLLAVIVLTICTTCDRKRRQRLHDERRNNIPDLTERRGVNVEGINTETENVYSYVGNDPEGIPQQLVAPRTLSEHDYAIDKSHEKQPGRTCGQKGDPILEENRYENTFAREQRGCPPDKVYYQNLNCINSATDNTNRNTSRDNEYDANSNRCSSYNMYGPINRDNERDIYNQLNHGNQQAFVAESRDPCYSHLQPQDHYQSMEQRPPSVPQPEYLYQNQSELFQDRMKMVWI